MVLACLALGFTSMLWLQSRRVQYRAEQEQGVDDSASPCKNSCPVAGIKAQGRSTAPARPDATAAVASSMASAQQHGIEVAAQTHTKKVLSINILPSIFRNIQVYLGI